MELIERHAAAGRSRELDRMLVQGGEHLRHRKAMHRGNGVYALVDEFVGVHRAPLSCRRPCQLANAHQHSACFIVCIMHVLCLSVRSERSPRERVGFAGAGMLASLSCCEAAAYFELQVQTVEDDIRQAEFDDATRFYRELAKIIPRFPIGYYGPFWDIKAGLGTRAEQCRSLAAVVRDPERQRKLLRLARIYQSAAEMRRAALR